jgi:hypothetical protein
MTHDEMIAVIQAHKDGKIIQGRSQIEHKPAWCDRDKRFLNFDFSLYDYRVKPEPMVVYVNKKKPCYAYTQNEVDSGSLQCSKDFTKFVEVLED